MSVSQTASDVRVDVRDEGPGLPAAQRTLLEEGTIDEFDNPGHGFGLNVVRFLVESFGGWIETSVTEQGSTVSVGLSVATDKGPGGDSELTRLSLDPAHLILTVGAGLIAAIPYGLLSEYLGGSVAAIGVFYGLGNPVVGWLTHEFHSVVFALIFAGLLSILPRHYRDHIPAATALGMAWGVVLWVVAAGLIAPVWLMLLGVDVSVPNLTGVLLVTHLTWGLALGILTSLGFRHLYPVVWPLLDQYL